MTWIISMPAWGHRYIAAAINFTIPSLLQALQHAGIDGYSIVIQTNQPEAFSKFPNITFSDVPIAPCKYGQLALSNLETINHAKPGDIVLPINADMVCSIELFSALGFLLLCTKKRLIMSAATRTATFYPPPIGVRARDLLVWAWRFRHDWIEDCVWGRGRSETLSQLYFEDETGVTLRAFHHHPIAFVKYDGLFCPGGLDDILIDHYPRDEVYVVRGADELAFAELSTPEPMFAAPGPITVDRVVQWANTPTKNRPGTRATEAHRWLFNHRVTIMGDGSQGALEREVCAQISERLDAPAIFQSQNSR